MFHQKKLVSIGLPVYNGERALARALDSLLGQTYQNIELIISDNASVDTTKAICEAYAKRDDRIIYIRQRTNTGVAENFSSVVEKSKGEFFMWGAHDDWWAPAFIERLVFALEQHPKCGVAMSSFARVYEDGAVYQDFLFEGKNDVARFSQYDMFYKTVVPGNPFQYFVCGLFNVALLKDMLTKHSPLSIRHDRVVMAEIALATRFCSIPEKLYVKTTYRQSTSDRYAGDSLATPYYGQKAYTRYAWEVFRRFTASEHIPVQRKLKAACTVYPRFLWKLRYRIIKEFPVVFAMGKGIRKLFV